MMNEYYDHYHRWEPLAEFHFSIKLDDEEDLYDEENYIYCLCSRVLIRNGLRSYYTENQHVSESEAEGPQESHSQEGDDYSQELDDHSHVHFSLDTSYKVKCEKDESASCYCSASHTENCCSTDEHDPGQFHGNSHALQPSDSGADLTFQDCHELTHDKPEKMDQDVPAQDAIKFEENYFSETTFERFWAVNGERLIWASWIENYSDYINPSYLNDTNELVLDDNNVPKPCTPDNVFITKEDTGYIRERKFSYDSKVNTYKKDHNTKNLDKNNKNNEAVTNKDEVWEPVPRRRSCSEHVRMLSPRTLACSDSMTNVTKITLSSYDVTSSHVTSNSSPTDDYSVSSSTSDDQSNDQTRIINIDEGLDLVPSEEVDPEQYWQFLWKKHFGEQYALHYANYIESKNSPNLQPPAVNMEPQPTKEVKLLHELLDVDCENSEGNSQEMPTIIEVQKKVDAIKLDEDIPAKPKRKNKKASNRYLGSVGVLLQNLLKEEQNKDENNKSNEVTEADDGKETKTKEQSSDMVQGEVESPAVEKPPTSTYSTIYHNNGGDDPPEEKAVNLKRGHEIDEEEVSSDKIKNTFETMGFCLDSERIPKGQLVYRKQMSRLRPPRNKRLGMTRKTYFDDDGNPYEVTEQPRQSQDERDELTDEDCPQVKSDTEKISADETEGEKIFHSDFDVENNMDEVKDISLEAADLPFPEDSDSFHSDGQDKKKIAVKSSGASKRNRRAKRRTRKVDHPNLPDDLKGDPKMLKYWKKRHSLFHRFDEGIRLDRESWFSVTPENVAWHVADKCRYDVVLDAFCGAGGNTIQFAVTCKKVIAVDIDPNKIEMAKHNASVYGVADRIEFIVGDFFELAPHLNADMVFLSPPWGGPQYSANDEYDIETMLEPRPASELMEAARTVNNNIALFLPRNSKTDQILSLAKETGGSIEIEQSYLDKRFVGITAYFYSTKE